MVGVGTLNERSLHAQLKEWYARPGDRFEVPVDGYVIDLVRRRDDADLLVEIQTRNVGVLRPKLEDLTCRHPVRVVVPVAAVKHLVKVDGDGEVLGRRRSPKRGRLVDVCAELVGIPDLLASPNLSIEVLLIEEEEVRVYDPARKRRRRGWATLERRLLAVSASTTLRDAAELAALLPDLGDRWTTASLAERAGISRRLAQQAAYVLRRTGQVRVVDRRGNALVYSALAGETTS